mmetsp:Transcript_68412/g.164222  ORF Transcript_68412/g.164222 Transcript_68412/m.164222 type:complete len:715 (-) Transcript_68412:8-2152(-)
MRYWPLLLLSVAAVSLFVALLTEQFWTLSPLPPPDRTDTDVWDDSSVWTAFEDARKSQQRSEEYIRAATLLQNGDYDAAKAVLAECTEAACQYLSGEMSITGSGEPRNLTKAMEAFTAAAEAGDANSQFALGALLPNMVEGKAAELRRREALSVLYLYAASLAGHPGALMAMGYRHSQGYGVPKSCGTAALNYLEVARKVARVYSSGMPQAIELVRLGVDSSRDKKTMSSSEVHVFAEIAASGNPTVAAAVGKRYLIGTDGFRQNYKQAEHFLRIAADQNNAEALALLGYMHSLGVGVEKNIDIAHTYFAAAAQQNDSSGLNGLGYIYFYGAPRQEVNHAQAFKLFNESAFRGSADGMFNVASLYLTGVGTDKSLHRAVLWFTEAIDRGHTPAAYALSVMYLNGIGVPNRQGVGNCKTAVELLKRVCERGSWAARQLQEAYDKQASAPDRAAWMLLRLAEAGHEVAQSNLAHMLDAGISHLLFDEEGPSDTRERVRGREKIYAQRLYSMSADQGNPQAELRLGDYAYYGWGLHMKDGSNSEEIDLDLESEEEMLAAMDDAEHEPVPQECDVDLAISHYRHAASLKITGEWMQPFAARASFNLGYLHQFGIGVPYDVALATRHYKHALEADPGGVHAPVTIMLLLLRLQAAILEKANIENLLPSLLEDTRTHLLVLNMLTLAVGLGLRRYLRHRRQVAQALRPGTPSAGGHLHEE